MAKQVSPGVLALRKVVDDVHKEAREAKARGELVGWSSSKFPCELAAAFDLHVMYPENQEERVLYLNLEEFSGLSVLMKEEYKSDLSPRALKIGIVMLPTAATVAGAEPEIAP